MNIGYACKHQTLGSGNKRITYSKFSTMSQKIQRIKLYELSLKNLQLLQTILMDNVKNNIKMFRITSGLFPLATHFNVLSWWDPIPIFKDELESIGKYINENDIRISFHPGQFTVLTSSDLKVTENAFNELLHNYNIFTYMKLKNTPDIIIHIGGKYNNLKLAITNFIRNFQKLPIGCQKMIRLENDQHIYTVQEVYHIAKYLDCPMILDIEHFRHNDGKINLDTAFYLFFDTWKNKNMKPKIHLSSQKEMYKRHAHADFIQIKDFKIIYPYQQYMDFDIMIEAKMTNVALKQLLDNIKHENILL